MAQFTQKAISLLVGVMGALCNSDKTVQAPQKMVDTTSWSVKEIPHVWPCKNGNLLRNGVSTHTGPVDLTTPLWEWTVPNGNPCDGHIETSVLIDRHSNVYIGSTIGGIFALAKDGTQLWAKQKKGRIFTGALDGDSLYVASSEGIAWSFDLATGNENWHKKYSKWAGMDGSSATVADGLALFAGASSLKDQFGGNSEIVALSTVNGSEKWRFIPDMPTYNFMPAVLDDKLIFIDYSGRIYCLSFSDGILQWKSGGENSGFTTAGVSVGPFGMAYTNFNTGFDSGGILVAYDLQTGAERWSRNLTVEASAAPVVGKLGAESDAPVGVVVGVGHCAAAWSLPLRDGKAELRAFDANTGADLWTFQTPSQLIPASAGVYSLPCADTIPDTFSTAAIGSDGTIYAGWQGSKEFAVEGATGKMISSYFSGYGDQGEPAIGDGFVVFATSGKLVAFGAPEHQDSLRSHHHIDSTEEVTTVFM